MGSRKDKFMVYMCLQSHELNGIMEIEWVNSYIWSDAVVSSVWAGQEYEEEEEEFQLMWKQLVGMELSA